MPEYTGPTGPTASYPGDPNDYSGGTSGINPNSVVDSIFSNLGNTLSGIGSIIGASKGNAVTYVNGQPVYPYGQQPPQQPQQGNTVLYIVLAVFFLLLLLGGAYLVTRK